MDYFRPFRTNNGRLALLAGLTALAFVLALWQGAGDPILVGAVQGQIENVRQNDTAQRVGNFIWQGTPKTNSELGKPPPPAAPFGRTWVWWGAFSILFAATLAYTPLAFREEAGHALWTLTDWLRGGFKGAAAAFGDFLDRIIGRTGRG